MNSSTAARLTCSNKRLSSMSSGSMCSFTTLWLVFRTSVSIFVCTQSICFVLLRRRIRRLCLRSRRKSLRWPTNSTGRSRLSAWSSLRLSSASLRSMLSCSLSRTIWKVPTMLVPRRLHHHPVAHRTQPQVSQVAKTVNQAQDPLSTNHKSRTPSNYALKSSENASTFQHLNQCRNWVFSNCSHCWKTTSCSTQATLKFCCRLTKRSRVLFCRRSQFALVRRFTLAWALSASTTSLSLT